MLSDASCSRVHRQDHGTAGTNRQVSPRFGGRAALSRRDDPEAAILAEKPRFWRTRGTCLRSPSRRRRFSPASAWQNGVAKGVGGVGGGGRNNSRASRSRVLVQSQPSSRPELLAQRPAQRGASIASSNLVVTAAVGHRHQFPAGPGHGICCAHRHKCQHDAPDPCPPARPSAHARILARVFRPTGHARSAPGRAGCPRRAVQLPNS